MFDDAEDNCESSKLQEEVRCTLSVQPLILVFGKTSLMNVSISGKNMYAKRTLKIPRQLDPNNTTLICDLKKIEEIL